MGPACYVVLVEVRACAHHLPPRGKRAAPVAIPVPPPRGPFVAPEAAAHAAEPLEGPGHRRPLVRRNGQVAGFELLLAPAVGKRMAPRGDSPSVLLHYSALFTAAATVTAGGRAALVCLPALLLNHSKLVDAASAHTLLLLDNLAAVPPVLAAALRARGVRLGVPDGPPSVALKPDFVVLQAAASGIDTLLLSAQRWREPLPKVMLVGLGLQRLEDLENALCGGITLAGGLLGQSREHPVARPLGASAHRICGLLNHLALDRDTAVIADEVGADATLNYRLLRYSQQPGHRATARRGGVGRCGTAARPCRAAALAVGAADLRPAKPPGRARTGRKRAGARPRAGSHRLAASGAEPRRPFHFGRVVR